jgi:hypothetical protein
MNKKTFILLFVLIQSIVFFSCKKETAQNTTALQSMTDLLTADSLKFDAYIIKWNTSKADTIYKRGSNRNSWDMDTSWFKFGKDGSYRAFISRNYFYSAQWQFLENGAMLRLWNANFDQHYTLLKLTKDTVEWLDPSLDNLFYRFLRK